MQMGRRSSKRPVAVAVIAGFALLVAACTSTVRASVASDGTQSNDHSFDASLSNDGRYVAFQSYATNLVSGDTNGRADAFVRDNTTKTVTRVSVTSNGQQGDRDAAAPRLDATGRYVAFISQATNFGGIGA